MPKCILCGKECENEYGNNSWPLAEGKCCDVCNITKVIPARLREANQETPMMQCGHSANSECDGKPCCVICAPDPRAFVVKEDMPDISGRKAICSDCDRVEDSRFDLPFFAYQPNSEYDKYYCGCRGWN